MTRTDFIAWLGVAAVLPNVDIPRSSMADEATAIARAAYREPLYNHALRSFLFARLIARAKSIRYDPELLYIAAIMHDVGLSPLHMSATERFEVDGANAARSLLEKHGVTASKVDVVWDAIALHDSGGLAKWKAPEVRLVNAGVAADFGAHLELLDRTDVTSVLRAAPRTGFVDDFLSSVAEVVKRKPFATGNCFVTDVGYRLVPGFHLDNFCDQVRSDPFAAY
jgi:HD domain-containing protein